MRRLIIIAILLLSLSSVKAAVSYSYTSPICGTLTGSFTNTSTGVNFGYLWVFDDPASGASNFALKFSKTTESHTFTAYGTYKVKLYIVNISSQPIDSVEHTIVINDLPAVILIPNSFQTYCLGVTENNFITASANPAYKYVWNPTPLSMSSPNSVEYAFFQTQTFSVTVTDTTTGCSVVKSITVTFQNCDPLTSQFTFITPQCGDYTVNFKNTSLTSHHYKWYFGDPLSGTNDTLSKPDSSSVFHTFSDTGVFNVSLVAYDSLETKSDSAVKQVHIYKLSRSNIFNADTTICKGTKVTLTGSGLGLAAWSPSTDLTATSGYNTIASPTVTTKYYLTTNNNGCVAIDSITINVLSKPDPGFLVDTLCINELYSFNASTTGYQYYHWDFGKGDTATGESVNYSFDTSGVYNVKLYVFNGFCDSTTTKQVHVLNDPLANFISDKSKAEITKATFLFSNKSKYSLTYLWDFGDLTSSSLPEPSHTYTDTGWFKVTLTAYNSLGCEDTFSIMIRVDNVYKYFVPSAFSPNLSGPYANEVFKPIGPAGTTKYEMLIFDRWGKEIFSSTDEKLAWEGKDAQGNDCEIGNYVYTIRFKDPTGKRLIFSGIVTLCR